MNTATTLEQLQALPASSLWGEIVTWRIPTHELPLADMLSALSAAGLPTDDAATIRDTTLFTRACQGLKKGRTIDKVTRDRNTGVLSYQFTRKELDAAGLGIDFTPEAIARFDPDSGLITCNSPEIEAHVITGYAHAIEYRNTSDVTRLVQRLFQSHADLLALEPEKGVAYFVPEPFRPFSAQVQQFLKAMGGKLKRFPVPRGDTQGNDAVRDTVEEAIAGLSDGLQASVDDWDEKTRQGTMDKAIQEWKLLRHKGESYAEYLGDRQATTLAMLDAQKQRMAEKITGVTAAKVAAKEVAKTTDASGDTQPPLFPERPLFPGATAPIGSGPTAADDFREDTEDVESVDHYDAETGEFQLADN